MTNLIDPPAPNEQDERHADRAILNLTCEVRQGTRPWQVAILEDLSPTGFRISSLARPDTAKAVSIRIPGIQLLKADIRWYDGKTVGCAFSAPLHVAVFEHLVRKIRLEA